MIYIIIFIISLVFIRKSAKTDGSKAKKFFVLSVIPLLFVATFRGLEVGTDIFYYQLRYFSFAKQASSFLQFLSRVTNKNEIVYAFITYVSSKIGSISVMFFLNELVILFCVYKSIWFFRKIYSSEIMLATFLVFFYARGMNTVRQSMAMSILLYAFCLINQKKYLLAIVLWIVAIGCHSSAIIWVSIIVLYFIAKSRFSNFYKVLIVMISAYVCISFRSLLVYISSRLSFLPSWYFGEDYISRDVNNIPVMKTIFILIALMISVITYRYYRVQLLNAKTLVYDDGTNTYHKKSYIDMVDQSQFLLYMMIISAFGIIVDSQATFTGRIFEYFNYYMIFVIPCAFNVFNKRNQTIIYVMMYLWFFVYFVYMYIVRGTEGVYPYSFEFIRQL